MTLDDLILSYTLNGGTLSGNELQTAARAAWSNLFQQTRGRLYTVDDDAVISDAVNNCFMELVDTIHAREVAGIITSESVGQWSRTRKDTAEGQTNTQIYTGIINRWLGGTGLLYRGWP